MADTPHTVNIALSGREITRIKILDNEDDTELEEVSGSNLAIPRVGELVRVVQTEERNGEFETTHDGEQFRVSDVGITYHEIHTEDNDPVTQIRASVYVVSQEEWSERG